MISYNFSNYIHFKRFRYEFIGSTVSTNSECMNRAFSGDPGFLWVFASCQTGGRGRRGKVWLSKPGNLHASLLLIDPAPSDLLSSLSFTVAVAVQSVIASVIPVGTSSVEIKWPNDLLIGQRKVSGILIECANLPNRSRAVVIGIGINVNYFPDNVSYPATSLKAEGSHVELEELYLHLFQEMERILVIWDQGKGREVIMDLWRRFACGIGKIITVNFLDRSLSGRFAGIDDTGFLLLETDKKCFIKIPTGEIFFDQYER